MSRHPDKLLRLSAHLEDLFPAVADCGGREALTPELADEIAATAGEIMVELADQRGDALAKQVIEDARKLREVVRTLRPEPAHIAEPWRALTADLELVIREEKKAA